MRLAPVATAASRWGHGWTEAGELKVGDRIRTLDGRSAVVEKIETSDEETVYNFRVAEYHTYFVGGPEWGFAVWAHNADYDATVSPRGALQIWEKVGGRRTGRTVLTTTAADIELESHRLANSGGLDLNGLRKALRDNPATSHIDIQLAARELPVLRPGSIDWDNAVRALSSGGKSGINVRTHTATEALELLQQARGNRLYTQPRQL